MAAPLANRGPLPALRAVTFWILAPLLTFYGAVIAGLSLLPAPRTCRWTQWIERLWGRAILVAAGARLRVEGAERVDPTRPRMFVANHASYLDPPALMAGLPGRPRFVMKRELRRLPFLGWYVALGGHFLIDRTDPRAGKSVLSLAMQRARRFGLSPAVFPEGTRSIDGRLQALRAGSFHLALEGGLDVQPVAILGSHAILPKYARAPRRSGEVLVRIGEVIAHSEFEGSAGRKAMATRVRAALLALGVPDGDAESREPTAPS